MWKECLPCLILGLFILVIYDVIFVIPLFIYSCYKWKISILFWISYSLWVWYDTSTAKTKGRKWRALQYFRIFHSVRDYFPLRLKKLADLPADRNYLFACFPHAIIPMGSVYNLTTNATGRAELFPDIDVRIVTINPHLLLPFSREYFMSIGFSNLINISQWFSVIELGQYWQIGWIREHSINSNNGLRFWNSSGASADYESIIYLLNSEPSKAIMIYPGGSKEILITRSGPEIPIIKENRKGFIRVALQTGTPLVPVFSFGENNIYDQHYFTSPITMYIAKQVYNRTKLRLPKLKGRGIFTRGGIFPRRHPVTTIVGRPLEVPKVEKPSPELIDEYHEKFYQALEDLFEEHKSMYDAAGDDARLCFK